MRPMLYYAVLQHGFKLAQQTRPIAIRNAPDGRKRRGGKHGGAVWEFNACMNSVLIVEYKMTKRRVSAVCPEDNGKRTKKEGAFL